MRHYPPDPPLTGAQRRYLAAFDALLRGDPGARELMAERLMPVLADAGLDPDQLDRSRVFRFRRNPGNQNHQR